MQSVQFTQVAPAMRSNNSCHSGKPIHNSIMQISLKQSEIVAALKAYVVQQGFNLAGKTVSIDFTAGRKESGITADIDIEDADQLPDLGVDDEISAVAMHATEAVIKTAAAPVALAVVKAAKAEPEVPADAAPVANQGEVVAGKGISLFN